MEWFERQYTDALSDLSSATTQDELSAALNALTSSTPEYLDYAQDYGGNYSDIHGSVLDTLRSIDIQSGTTEQPNITVLVKIGDKPIEDMTVEVLNNSQEAQLAVQRITA